MEEKEFGNIIRVAEKKIQSYEHAILLAACPEVYDKYNCIIIQTTVKNLPTAELLVKLFQNLGIYEENREKKPITVNSPDGNSYVLTNAYEITLKKIPALRH